ncbi:putative membrane protein [Brevundimonas alba]|uniref:Putative membrane protein n=1 Tax=Brevundimonas alba TaxID=74314 RepID=A0A7X6BNZ6_9CAUL|nr:putative membrane protein [Brevundimonas alba]
MKFMLTAAPGALLVAVMAPAVHAQAFRSV